MTFEENWEEDDVFFHAWPLTLHKKFMADISPENL
jgi:hypothetical protein